MSTPSDRPSSDSNDPSPEGVVLDSDSVSASPPPGQRQAAVHQGIKWLGFSLGFSRMLRLGTTVLLMRLLAKEYFGVIALANGAILAMSAFREVGFSQALIHRKCKDAADEQLSADTVFWILVASNSLLFVLGLVATPWVADFYGEEFISLGPVLRAMLVLFLIEGVMITPSSLLHKRLDFRSVSIFEMRATVAYAILALGSVYAGLGIWSMVIGQLGSRALQAVWLCRAAGFFPRFRWDGAIAIELFRYGRWLWATAALQAFSRSGDRFLVGRMGGGPAMLGSYGMAFNLCNAPTQPVGNIINRVAFPALSQVRDDPARVAASLNLALALVTFAVLPAVAGLAAVADDFVVTIYSEKWWDMVPIVRILAFYGGALAMGSISRPVLLALGRPKVVMLVSTGHQIAVLALLAVVAFQWREGMPAPGILVAWAVLIPAILAVTVGMKCAASACGASMRAMGVTFLRTALPVVLMLLVVAAVRDVCSGWAPWMRLQVSALVGVATYAVASWFLNRPTLEQFRREFGRVLNSKKAR